jgi:hypothetical protein
MPYSDRYQPFFDDKVSFFQSPQEITKQSISGLATGKSYSFLVANREMIEDEYNHLKNVLTPNDSNAYWLYCYYCCVLLSRYYRLYDKKDQAEDFDAQSRQILAHANAVATNGGSLTNKVKRKIGQGNMQRLAFTFGRLTVKESFKLASALKWLDKLDNFGIHVDANNIAQLIDGPGVIFNALSVGLFASRFAVNAGMILKHTFSPNGPEQELTSKARFYKELYDRHYHLLNDLAWIIANILCNYNAVCHISDAAAGWITAGFLVFDLTLLLIEHRIAKTRYLTKKSQYMTEKGQYQAQMDTADITLADLRKCQEHCNMLNKQLEQLEAEWVKNCATLSCDITAALILGCGWTAALLIATPTAIVISYFSCVIAVSLYISDGAYGKYKEKSFLLQQHELVNANDVQTLRGEMQQARTELIKSLAKNTLVPMLLVSVIAISWPAAILLSVTYIANELDCFTGKAKPPAQPARSGTVQRPESENDSLENSGETRSLVTSSS